LEKGGQKTREAATSQSVQMRTAARAEKNLPRKTKIHYLNVTVLQNFLNHK
jgi:hypothetical protein